MLPLYIHLLKPEAAQKKVNRNSLECFNLEHCNVFPSLNNSMIVYTVELRLDESSEKSPKVVS